MRDGPGPDEWPQEGMDGDDDPLYDWLTSRKPGERRKDFAEFYTGVPAHPAEDSWVGNMALVAIAIVTAFALLASYGWQP